MSFVQSKLTPNSERTPRPQPPSFAGDGFIYRAPVQRPGDYLIEVNCVECKTSHEVIVDNMGAVKADFQDTCRGSCRPAGRRAMHTFVRIVADPPSDPHRPVTAAPAASSLLQPTAPKEAAEVH